MRVNTVKCTQVLFLFIGLICTSMWGSPEDSSKRRILQSDKASFYEEEAIRYTEDGDYEAAIQNMKYYILETGDFSILDESEFIDLSNEATFKELVDQYVPKFSISNFFFLYVGLIGLFIAFILTVRRNTDRVANGLIGLFVFMHSFFLIHVSLYLSNYTYEMPHTLSMSTFLSFLYGPVLYFYFKRISENYAFKRSDLLHLLPTLGCIVLFIPIYTLSEADKLQIMLGVGAYGKHPFLTPVTIIKLLSLGVYGFLTFRIYRRSAAKNFESTPKKVKLQKTIMIIHTVYALSYGLYAIVIIRDVWSGIFFNGQLFAMTSLVLYIGYIAYSNPQVLVGIRPKVLTVAKPKYKNSGLTPSFSLELKEQLIALLENEKVYRESSIKLESIAERLGTTRHNASQVINEHFDLNFFELINKYRVEEAMELLKDNENNLNIIDIAYEVGYNNKVTFNKSFKRFCNLTPSQFVKLGQAS